MAKAGFEYYALHYLNLWLSQDRACCEALVVQNGRKEKLRALADAAVNYRIARTLPTRYDRGRGLPRYGPVLEIIEARSPADFRGEKLVQTIEKVKKEIADRYGGHGGLSLTTKFLWFKMKSPIIIYDSQARKALHIRPDRLDEYYSAWRSEFSRNEKQVQHACSSLPRVHRYTRNPQATTPKCIAEIAVQPWFIERVFDVYLWHRGLET